MVTGIRLMVKEKGHEQFRGREKTEEETGKVSDSRNEGYVRPFSNQPALRRYRLNLVG